MFIRNCMIIPQQKSYLGMSVSRRTMCCNIQDLFDLLDSLCKGLSKQIPIINGSEPKRKNVPGSSGIKVLKGEGRRPLGGSGDWGNMGGPQEAAGRGGRMLEGEPCGVSRGIPDPIY